MTAHTNTQQKSKTPGFWDTMQEFVPNFRDEQVSSNLKKLVLFSLSIIALPLASMVLVKRFIFEGLMGLSNSDALLYSAILAVVLVHVILFGFVYAAWTDDEAQPQSKARRQAEKID